MSQYACAVLGASLGIGGAVLALLSRYLPRPRPAAAAPAPTAVIRTGYRWCPIEQRTVVAFVRSDGSGTCADLDCRAHIPAPQEAPRA